MLSPGPCTPNEAGICLDLIAAAAGKIPMLGVCLGPSGDRPGIRRPGGARAGADARQGFSRIFHAGTDILEGLPSPFSATRYHSLIVDRATLPDVLVPTAWTEDGLVMGMRHRSLPIFGVQFHPESIASQHGHELLANFLAIARGTNAPARAA